MNIQICDYCGERWPKHRIEMSRRPNDEDLFAELCDKCLDDISDYIIHAKKPEIVHFPIDMSKEQLDKYKVLTPAIGINIENDKVKKSDKWPRSYGTEIWN